jgi:hypothetical protein
MDTFKKGKDPVFVGVAVFQLAQQVAVRTRR